MKNKMNTNTTPIEYAEMTPAERDELRGHVGESQGIGSGFTEESAERRGDHLTFEMLEIIDNSSDPWDAYHSFKSRIDEFERAAFAASEYGKEWDKQNEGGEAN